MTYEAEELINRVEIVEPPIEELKKRGHWFITSCLSGGGCVLIFIIGIILGVKLFIGPGPKQIKNIPANFPADIPLYDQYNLDKITYISGRYKSRSMELVALFPKIALSPLIFSDQQGPAQKNTGAIREIFRVLFKPVADSRDMIQIEWFDISSKPEEMTEYYETKLESADFTIDSETTGESYHQFTFKRGNTLSGTLYVETTEKNKIPYAFIIVNLPQPKNEAEAPSPESATGTPDKSEHDTI